MKSTNTGRVVYTRKKHKLSLTDVVRMLERLSNTLTRSELDANPYICNALFEIVRTAFYPTWQRASNNSVYRNRSQTDPLIDAIESSLRAAWQQSTFDTCRLIGDNMGIPAYIQDFVIDYLGTFIWDVIWAITDPFFS